MRFFKELLFLNISHLSYGHLPEGKKKNPLGLGRRDKNTLAKLKQFYMLYKILEYLWWV